MIHASRLFGGCKPSKWQVKRLRRRVDDRLSICALIALRTAWEFRLMTESTL